MQMITGKERTGRAGQSPPQQADRPATQADFAFEERRVRVLFVLRGDFSFLVDFRVAVRGLLAVFVLVALFFRAAFFLIVFVVFFVVFLVLPVAFDVPEDLRVFVLAVD